MTMERYIPYEKLSKKKKRESDKKRRGGWGEINPITRKRENKKAYNRKKTEFREDTSVNVGFYFYRFAA